MFTLWYIILGWKKCNNSFTERTEFPPDHLPKKQVSTPEKTDGAPAEPTGANRKAPELPKSPSPSNFPRAPESPSTNLLKDFPKGPEDPKPISPSRNPDPPKKVTTSPMPEKPILPEVPKFSLVNPKAPESPWRKPESPKSPVVPKAAPKTPDSPEKSPVVPKAAPKTPGSPEGPAKPEPVPSRIPPKGPGSDVPQHPSNPSQEFPLPPYLPGSAGNREKPPAMSGDELFAMGSNARNQDPTKGKSPVGELRDLSYAKGELPEDSLEKEAKKLEETVKSPPWYREEIVSSSSDDLSSGEDY